MEITSTDTGTVHHPRIDVSTQLPDAGDTVTATIFGPAVSFGELQPAVVNWSALGSKTPTDALAYARLLERAATDAQRINREHGFDA
jgi:hypothetical protein